MGLLVLGSCDFCLPDYLRTCHGMSEHGMFGHDMFGHVWTWITGLYMLNGTGTHMAPMMSSRRRVLEYFGGLMSAQTLLFIAAPMMSYQRLQEATRGTIKVFTRGTIAFVYKGMITVVYKGHICKG